MELASVYTHYIVHKHIAFSCSECVVRKGRFVEHFISGLSVLRLLFRAHVHLTLRQINLLMAQEGLQNYCVFFLVRSILSRLCEDGFSEYRRFLRAPHTAFDRFTLKHDFR